MTLPRFAVGQCGCIEEKLKTIVLTLLSVFISTSCPFPQPTFTGARGAHKRHQGITIHITESKIYISYSKNHDSTLFFYYFYMSPLPILVYIIAKGSTFLISSPFDITKLQKKMSWYVINWQLSVPNVNGHAYSYPLPHPMAMGTQPGFKRYRKSHHLSIPKKTMVSTLLSVIISTGLPFPHPTFMGVRRAHKRHQGYNYSYHWVQNSYQLLKHPGLTLMLSSIIFTWHPFQPLVHIFAKSFISVFPKTTISTLLSVIIFYR